MLKILISVILAVGSLFTTLYGHYNPVPDPSEDSFRVQYGEEKCNYMDIFLPENTEGKCDVMLAIHGGSWMAGDQTSFGGEARDACQHGYIGVTVDYSKIFDSVGGKKVFGKATALTMVNEIYAAVGKLKEVMTERGIEIDKMLLYGHSSGSHLALLYAYTHCKDSPIPIGMIVAMSSPADLTLEASGKTLVETWRSSLLTALTGEDITDFTIKTQKGAAAVAAINPIDHVSADVPPTLLAHGDKDNLIPYENSPLLCEKLQSVGVPSKVITFAGEEHFIRFSPIEMRQELIHTARDWAELYM